MQLIKKIFYTVVVLALIVSGGYYFTTHKQAAETATYKTEAEADPYVRFGMEAFDLIQANYWDETSHYDLPNIMKLSLEKATGVPQTIASSTRFATAQMFESALKTATTTDAKKNLVVNTLIIATYNLQPAGRNGMLSATQEKELRQTVSNVNPAKDLYQDLGIEKGASIADVKVASARKESELKASTTPEAKAELVKVAYAKKVLTDENSKQLYDQGQIEPTVWTHKIGNTLYLYVSQIAPTTFIEFARAIDNASTTPNLNSMILDFRGNIGGDLGFAQNFLGLFMGQNQYAFDLFHQGKYDAQRTVQPKFGELDRYKEFAILTDNMTQSTAEVVSAAFKRLHLGRTVGANSRGWGTVENTYPITTEIDPNTKYTLLLVNSITMRDDNQPIEGRGVDPDVSTADPKWKSKLSSYFNSQSLITALGQTAASPVLK